MRIFLITLIIFLGLGNLAHADSLNAGVVSDVWYSSSQIYEGDVVRIYSGIYNSSDTKVTGIASYFVDAQEVQKVPFISAPKSLIQIEGRWTAVGGDHKVQVKISTSTQAMVKMESDEGLLSVQKPIVKKSLKEEVQNIITKTLDVIDPLAEKLAGNVEQLGNAIGAGTSTATTKSKNATSTTPMSLGGITDTVVDSGLSGIGFLIRHWAWTIFGIVVLYFVIKKY